MPQILLDYTSKYAIITAYKIIKQTIMKMFLFVLLVCFIGVVFYVNAHISKEANIRRNAHYIARNMSDQDLSSRISYLRLKKDLSEEEKFELDEYEMELQHRADLIR